MAIAEANMKRKSELEDITNTNTNYNKKAKQMNNYKRRKVPHNSSPKSSSPKQSVSKQRSVRSPSPLDQQSVDDSPKKDYKSVTFDCPLLTPKDEDYYNHLDVESPGVASNTQFNHDNVDLVHIDDDDTKPYNAHNELNSTYTVNPPTPPCTHDDEPLESKPDSSDLDTNPDYIVLTSSLRLLSNNHQQILSDIEQLSGLLNSFKTCDDQQEFMDFFHKLVNNDLKLPKQHKILKSPVINLNKYNLSQNNVGGDLISSSDKPLFKTLNLFGNSSK